MAKIAILGFGTVGSGVLEVVRANGQGLARRAGEAVEVKYICDIRDFSGHPDAALFVNNIDVILSDPEVRVVVETIGGLKPAYFYVKSALESGRHVVTSNKELVATHGAELLRIAREHGVCFLFEASVGGGTPVITPMHQCLAANVITEVLGIVNGTTNFMLTKMAEEGLSFDEALKEAQRLGYAETIDPSADVDGIDAQRKICILASIALGHHFYPQDVPARGIRDIAVQDIRTAREMGYAVRLIARMICPQDRPLEAGVSVEPMLVPLHSPLANVRDVYNAVLMRCDMLGDVVFYGKGAGKLPTASAVAADVADALREGVSIHETLYWKECPPLPEGCRYAGSETSDWYVRGEGSWSALDAHAQPVQQTEAGMILLVKGKTAEEMEKLRETAAQNGFFVKNVMRLLAE